MKRRIWWDCSYLYAHPEINTGIERVTRHLGTAIAQLCSIPDSPYSFHPCVSVDTGTVLELASIPGHNSPTPEINSSPTTLYPPDIFVASDSTWDHHILANKAAPWRAGVTLGVIQYDVVPLTHPETTTEYMVATFRDWVGECATFADFYACISQTTTNELTRVLQQQYPWRQVTPADIFNFPLGTFLPDHRSMDRATPPKDTWNFLAVGTIEPRKRYDIILDTFNQLWRHKPDLLLTVVGKAGWKTDDVTERVRDLQRRGAPIVWLDQASDAELQAEYAKATALIAASDQEGFGLPVLEALSFGTPVIAADIPIFREVADTNALYFETNNPTSLANTLLALTNNTVQLPTPADTFIPPTWHDSASAFLTSLESCAIPKHYLRTIYDHRVAHLIKDSPTPATSTARTADSEQTHRANARIAGALTALYTLLSRRHLLGYPIRLANAILHSSSTRWHLFKVEQTMASQLSTQASLTEAISALREELSFLETRLTSLIALEHDHSRAVLESVLAMMDEPSRKETS